MSALAAAQSQDTTWQDRYNEYETQMETAMDEAMKIAGSRGLKIVKQLKNANDTLVHIEKRSFILNSEGEYERSISLMKSDQYIMSKSILHKFLEELEFGNTAVFGVIVINNDANMLIHENILLSSLYDMVVTNSEDGILHHSDISREWGFEFGLDNGLGTDFPSSRDAIVDESERVIWHDELGEIHVVGRIPLDEVDSTRYLGLTMVAQRQEVLAHVTGLRTKIIVVSTLAIGLTTILCGFGVRRLTHPSQSSLNRPRE